jgi:hypothetical protein
MNYAGGPGILSGGTTVKFQNGIATFNQMSAECSPGGHIDIEYTVSLTGVGTEYEVNTIQSLSFRNCSDGEVLVARQCFRCQNNTYSLTYTPDAKVCESICTKTVSLLSLYFVNNRDTRSSYASIHLIYLQSLILSLPLLSYLLYLFSILLFSSLLFSTLLFHFSVMAITVFTVPTMPALH